MCQVTSIWYEMHKLITWNPSWKTFTMMPPPYWLFVFTCLCSSWVHLEVWDAGSLPGKACLHSLCGAGLSARSGGHWEYFQAGFQRTAALRCFWILTDLILIGMKCHHLKAIFNKCLCSAVDGGRWCQRFSVGSALAGGSMLISAVCCFFLFFGNSESAMIGWQCLFCGASIAAWNALDVITVELYPTDKRCSLHFSF